MSMGMNMQNPYKGLIEIIDIVLRKMEFTEKTFAFATYARKAFLMTKGKVGLELKKEILLALGKTPIIKVIRKGKRPFEMCLTYSCSSKSSWNDNTKSK